MGSLITALIASKSNLNCDFNFIKVIHQQISAPSMPHRLAMNPLDKKLNEEEGTDKYRPPSEAEWEQNIIYVYLNVHCIYIIPNIYTNNTLNAHREIML